MHYLYRFTFGDDVDFDAVRESLALSLLATESLDGETRVRLDAQYAVDPEQRTCVIDGGTAVGVHLAQIFAGFMGVELGDGACHSERLVLAHPQEAA